MSSRKASVYATFFSVQNALPQHKGKEKLQVIVKDKLTTTFDDTFSPFVNIIDTPVINLLKYQYVQQSSSGFYEYTTVRFNLMT